MIRRFLDRLERKILLRSYGVDPDAARKPASTDDPVGRRFYEVKTTRGWRLWRRGDLKNRD